MPRVWPSTSSATARASDTSTTTCSQLPRPPREGRQARDGPASGTHRRPVRRLRSTLRGQVPSLIVDSTVVALASIIEVLEMHLAVWRRRPLLPVVTRLDQPTIAPPVRLATVAVKARPDPRPGTPRLCYVGERQTLQHGALR